MQAMSLTQHLIPSIWPNLTGHKGPARQTGSFETVRRVFGASSQWQQPAAGAGTEA